MHRTMPMSFCCAWFYAFSFEEMIWRLPLSKQFLPRINRKNADALN
ncbi:hypothetical protein [Xanthocytophaga flava]|nr:hypothetical protein [Xanthocytophaga flavus]